MSVGGEGHERCLGLHHDGVDCILPARFSGASAHVLPSSSRVLHEGGTRSVHAVSARI